MDQSGAAASRACDTSATVDAQRLGGNADIAKTVSGQHGVEIVPIRRRLPRRDVQPLHHHRAVESFRVSRQPDQDPRLVRGGGIRSDLPAPVARGGSSAKGVGCPRGKELLLGVAVACSGSGRGAGLRLDHLTHGDRATQRCGLGVDTGNANCGFLGTPLGVEAAEEGYGYSEERDGRNQNSCDSLHPAPSPTGYLSSSCSASSVRESCH